MKTSAYEKLATEDEGSPDGERHDSGRWNFERTLLRMLVALFAALSAALLTALVYDHRHRLKGWETDFSTFYQDSAVKALF